MITDTQILAIPDLFTLVSDTTNIIFVMKRGALHRASRKQRRLQFSNGRQSPSSADLNRNRMKRRLSLLSREYRKGYEVPDKV